MVSGLGSLDKALLMELQYSFPLTPTPYCDVAQRLGIAPAEALSRMRALAGRGVVKRIGFYLNYRAQGMRAALVAFAAGERYQELAGIVNNDPLVTHNYLRDHPVYNVWVVVKRRSLEDLVGFAKRVAEKAGARDWVVLIGKRTYKLSVKYDLYQGVSRSGPYSRVAENPPRPEELGAPRGLAEKLRRLPLVEKPYNVIGEEYGLSGARVAVLAKTMLEKGVLGDPGAALDGRLVGFQYNAMAVVAGGEEACECAASLEYSTHVVLRSPYPRDKWPYNCYFMVHGTSRALVENVLNVFTSRCGFEAHPIYSIADLKPGALR